MSSPVAKPHYPMSSTVLVKVRGIRSYQHDEKLASISSVTGALVDAEDDTITGSAINLEVDDEADDIYAGRFPHSIELTRGQEVRIQVVVTGVDADGNTLVKAARKTAWAEYAGFEDD